MSEPWPSNGLVQAPAAADSDFSFIPGQGCISPQQLMLVPVIEPYYSLATTTSPNPTEAASSFDFNSPLELSQSPPTTVASHSPASNIQTPPRASPSSGLPPLACDHCHIPATDVALLVKHIKVDHPSASGRLFCGNQRCKDVKDERSLERHLRDHHLGLPYICRCGRKDRKDKHRKHLRQCTHPARSAYVCMCGNEVDSSSPDSRQAHEAHFESCGKRKRGRRRKEHATGK